jgi:hypothetical protein
LSKPLRNGNGEDHRSHFKHNVPSGNMKRITRTLLGTEHSKIIDRIEGMLDPDLGGLTTMANIDTSNVGDPEDRSTMFVKILNTDLPEPWESEVTPRLVSVMENEVSSILRKNPLCKQASFRNGEVWAAFLDENEEGSDLVYVSAVSVNSVIMVINRFAEKHGYPKLRVGVGLSYGQSRLAQVSKKTMTSEEIWVGEGFRSAREAAVDACHEEGTEWEIHADESFFGRLPEERKAKSFVGRRSSKVSNTMLKEYELLEQ